MTTEAPQAPKTIQGETNLVTVHLVGDANGTPYPDSPSIRIRAEGPQVQDVHAVMFDGDGKFIEC